MLEGLNSILAESQDIPVRQIQSHILAHKNAFLDLKSVCGSFKNVYQISDKYAVSCIKDSQGPEIFSKEIKLLSTLREIRLPVIQYYGDMFEITPGYYAYLIDWVNNATLLDSKDADATNSKLVALVLGVNIPSGEGWVLHKDRVEREIKNLLETNESVFESIKQKASILHASLTDIQRKLEDNNLAVCDLQFLITPSGEVWVIDPQDIAKENKSLPNKVIYTSLLDDTEQTDPGYRSQLNDGKNMLSKSIEWCNDVMSMNDTQQLIDFVIRRPEQKPTSPRDNDLFKQMMQKRSPRTLLHLEEPVSTSELSPRRKKSSPPRVSMLRLPKTIMMPEQTLDTTEQLIDRLKDEMTILAPMDIPEEEPGRGKENSRSKANLRSKTMPRPSFEIVEEDQKFSSIHHLGTSKSILPLLDLTASKRSQQVLEEKQTPIDPPFAQPMEESTNGGVRNG